MKGVLGLGLPTVASGVLSLVMTPAQAAAILVIPSLVTNVWQAVAGPHTARLVRRLFTMLQALGLSFTVSTLALATVLGSHGIFSASAAGLSMLALVPALAGMWTGQAVRSRIRAETFRRWFFVGLLLLGVHLAGADAGREGRDE